MVAGMFRSGDLPVAERLAAAHELFGRGALPMRLAARGDQSSRRWCGMWTWRR